MHVKANMRRLLQRAASAGHGDPKGPVEPGPAPAVSTTFSKTEQEILERVGPYTLTSPERLIALMDATEYVVRRDIPGAVVECGVWRGGSVLAAIEVLLRLGVTDREVYLYDTFEGMTAPTEMDTSSFEEGRSALDEWKRYETEGRRPWDWAFNQDIFSLDDVRALLEKTGYPAERMHFVVGPVEQTLPAHTPGEVALLRLDTDWYESTRHELLHLYPKLSTGGVLIIDDYGHWDGARRAVDEYFAAEAPALLLARIDYTGRIGVKA
ncbi:MAG TPA: TylF/MycF/NovP-related O-methyltransferase [Acidimicrobiales bacterium]|nr:TylF/MycF/NovP-related O-methyltransferase [Acidimicrobiales bacterium]